MVKKSVWLRGKMVIRQFTKEQKHMLTQCILDCNIFGLSDKQAMEYVEEKTGRQISLTFISKIQENSIG
jgi:hypothetical protein